MIDLMEYQYSKGIIQRMKKKFLLQNLGYYLKKKKKSEYSGPEYIFAWNGLVFKARQHRCVVYTGLSTSCA